MLGCQIISRADGTGDFTQNDKEILHLKLGRQDGETEYLNASNKTQ